MALWEQLLLWEGEYNADRVWYDYDRQAWVHNGRYVRCGHPEARQCGCYGREHEGEATVAPDLTEVPSDRLLLVARMGIDGRSNGVDFAPEHAIEELKRRGVAPPASEE